MSYILFYSKVDKFSKQLISKLSESGEIRNFAAICVDKDVSTGQRPAIINKYQITSVPTIIVNNQKLSGVHAFKWVEKQSQPSSSGSTMNTRAQVNVPKTRAPVQSQNVISGYDDNTFAVVGEYDDKNRPSVGYCQQASSAEDVSRMTHTDDDSYAERMKGGFIMKDDALTPSSIQYNGSNGGVEETSKSKQHVQKSQEFEDKFEKMQRERQQEDDYNKKQAQPFQYAS
ncbi:hypothetical protein CCP3SC1AL1_1100004 [Gammaproteobacteria bacterium]